ncbi:hypothetical protein Sjap_023777 [Stephania japonica]|uniref:Protein kinase domain-containing protein n=1 Tax=Stephania japonica TaxID=461633 RepID=A0AAP0HPJ1_9MAGN
MKPRIYASAAYVILRLLSAAVTAAQLCSPPPSPPSPPSPPCSPASLPSSYPFSATPGCGHPSFQIKCSPPHWVISINNFSFAVTSHRPNSTTILVTLLPTTTTPPNPPRSLCFSSPHLPTRPIDLSPSPFRFPNSLCSRLSVVRPCSPSPSPSFAQNCALCRSTKTVPLFSESAQTEVIQFSSSPTVRTFRSRMCSPCNCIWNTDLEMQSGQFFKECARSRRRPDDGVPPPPRSANLLPPVFTFEELESSTNRFDPRRKIGDGGFGSVFLGLLRDGRVVAVKKLHTRATTTTTTKSFCNEILILSSMDHPNLVKLHGYCSDPRGLLLVYDYVPNGSLADHLHGSKGSPCLLQWRHRLEVALQTALAIEYLHFSVKPPIVHRDITSSNIFIDSEMRIKLGDFGLSRLLILSQSESKLSSESVSSSSSGGFVWTGPQGTPGYLDPEYYRSFRLTEKSDVYSFGVVMFELITGLRAVDHVRREALADLVVSRIQMGMLRQVVDPILMVDDDGGEGMGAVDAVAELAFRCVAADKDDRPDARRLWPSSSGSRPVQIILSDFSFLFFSFLLEKFFVLVFLLVIVNLGCGGFGKSIDFRKC